MNNINNIGINTALRIKECERNILNDFKILFCKFFECDKDNNDRHKFLLKNINDFKITNIESRYLIDLSINNSTPRQKIKGIMITIHSEDVNSLLEDDIVEELEEYIHYNLSKRISIEVKKSTIWDTKIQNYNEPCEADIDINFVIRKHYVI